jgi:hypothetical protein
MNINVKPEFRNHFFQEPPEGTTMEFWSFGRWKPRCETGDELVFRFDKVPVAKAVVAKVEPPGKSSCGTTGRFQNSWKVWWHMDDFEVLPAGTEWMRENAPKPPVPDATLELE